MFDRVRSLLHRSTTPPPRPGTAAVTSGLAALAGLENAVSDRRVVSGIPLGGAPDDPTWRTVPAGSGAVAEAVGMATAGLRVALFVDGAELDAGLDRLAAAAARGVPLVVYAVGRARPAQGIAFGTGHEAWHRAARSLPVLVAGSVQEAVDLGVAARRLAEDRLVPVVVGLDAAEIAFAVADVRLPGDSDLIARLGRAGDTVHASDPAQALALGKHRRRVPRRLDGERPALDGVLLDGAIPVRGLAARETYDRPLTRAAVGETLAAVAADTGRDLAPTAARDLAGASLVLVTTGGLVEPARAAVARARGRGRKVGMVALRALSPFPAESLAGLLGDAKRIVALDRAAPGFAPEGDLALALRAALPDGGGSRMLTAYAGLAGAPVRPEDLDALLDTVNDTTPSPLWIGVTFQPADDTLPKRRVLFDALRREYPDAPRHGVRGGTPAPTAEATVVTLHRAPGEAGTLLGALAALAATTTVRARSGAGFEEWGRPRTDRLLLSETALDDPGDDLPADLAVWFPEAELPRGPEPLAEGADVLLEARSGGSLWADLPANLRRRVRAGEVRLHAVPVRPGETPAARGERLLGGALALLRGRGVVISEPRQLLAERRETLADTADREALLDRFQEGLDGVHEVVPGSDPADVTPRETVPELLRTLRSHADTADSPARFWDTTGILLARGEADAIAPDPHLATGILPPLTSTFTHTPGAVELFPAFDPDPCTGCGDCWSACPDGAILARPVTPSKLLEAGQARVKRDGGNADSLRMAAGRIAGRLAGAAGGDAGTLVADAVETHLAGATLPAERKEALAAAGEAVASSLRGIPLARTAVFAEGRPDDETAFLALAIDPDRCKGCGLCVSVCAPEALSRAPRSPERWAAGRFLRGQVNDLPGATPAEREHVAGHSAAGPLAAALLGPGARLLGGGNAAEPGSGPHLAVRQVMALVAEEADRTRRAQRAAVDEVASALADRVRDRLAGALPLNDLEALADGLGAVDRPDVDLADLVGRVEGVVQTERVDAAALRRLVDAARGVRDLAWRLDEGERGLGRSLLALAADRDVAPWLGTWPDNPSAVPVLLDEAPGLLAAAHGAFEGLVEPTLEGFRALRRARRLLDRPGEPEPGVALPRTFADLTPEERAAVPPLVVVAGPEALAAGWSALLRIFDEERPILVVALLDPSPVSGMGGATGLVTSTESPLSVRGAAGLDAHAHPRSSLYRATVVPGTSLADAVRDARAAGGPALLEVLAPRPSRADAPSDATFRLVTEAVEAGRFGPPAPPEVPDVAAPPASDAVPRPEHDAILARVRAEAEARAAAAAGASKVELAVTLQRRLRNLLATATTDGGDR